MSTQRLADASKLDCLLDTFAKVSRRTPREMRDGDTCESDEIETLILQAQARANIHAYFDAHEAEKAGPDERICHAPGEKCCGCPHYYGRAASCVYKDAAPAQPPAPEPQGDFFSAAIRLLTESGCHDAADHLRTVIAARLAQPAATGLFYVIEFAHKGHPALGEWWRGSTKDEATSAAWTRDIHKAIKYADRASAERAYELLGWGAHSHVITEHAWIAQQPAEAEKADMNFPLPDAPAQPAPEPQGDLPSLPKDPRVCMTGEGAEFAVYTMTDMQTYARAAIAALQQPPAIPEPSDVEAAARAICREHGFDPDEPVRYAGTRRKVKEIDGHFLVQWEMQELAARAAIVADRARLLAKLAREESHDR